ncbi:MAG: hypothetical protein QF805_22760, partial [Pirellulaceae bacterium]|nr:hypothetical protein [Pirellulaceae bacterium]
MRRSAQLSALVLVAALQAGALHARLPYKTIIDKLDAKTEREKHFQKEVKKSKCNSCHEKKKKKVL